MGDPHVKTIFEADDKGQQEAIANLQKNMERLRETNERMAKESREHHEREEAFHFKALEFGKEQIASVKENIVEYVTLRSAIELTTEARKKLTEVTKEAASERLTSSTSLVGMLRDSGQIQNIGMFEKAFEQMPGRDEDKLRRMQESLRTPFLSPQQYVENAKAASNLGAYTDATGSGELLGQIGYMAPGLSPEQRSRLTVEAFRQTQSAHGQLLEGVRDEQFRRLVRDGAFGQGQQGVTGALGFASALLQAGGSSRHLSALEAVLTEKFDAPTEQIYPSGRPPDPKDVTRSHLRNLDDKARLEYLSTHQGELANILPENSVPFFREAFANWRARGAAYESALGAPIPGAPSSPMLERVERNKAITAAHSTSAVPYANEGEFNEEFFGEKGRLETIWNKYYQNEQSNAARIINEKYTRASTAMAIGMSDTDVSMINLKGMVNREENASGPLHQLFSEALRVLREIRDRTPTQAEMLQRSREQGREAAEANRRINHDAVERSRAISAESKATNALATQRE